MTFWNTTNGILDGKEESSFTNVGSMILIPNNTYARAIIIKPEIKEITFNGQIDRFYSFTYKLIDGEFKDAEVQQKVRAFGAPSPKRDRAINMLYRLFKLCSVPMREDGSSPTEFDMLQFIGKTLGIRIQEWQQNGKEGNWVSEVHSAEGFETKTGTKLALKSHDHSPYKTESLEEYDKMQGDLPF